MIDAAFTFFTELEPFTSMTRACELPAKSWSAPHRAPQPEAGAEKGKAMLDSGRFAGKSPAQA